MASMRTAPSGALPRLLGREPGCANSHSAVAHHAASTHIVVCPDGHEMRAKLPREMLQLMRCSEHMCTLCERGLTDHDAYYRCKACDLDYCLSCSRQQLGLSAAIPAGSAGEMLQLGPGDILLVGPDRYDIHHVVLVRGTLEAAPESLSEVVAHPPGTELLSLATIESTQAQQGDRTWWYPTNTILQRDAHAGTAFVLADLPDDSESVYTLPEPIPFKVLLHPLRTQCGNPELELERFEWAVQVCAERSRQYGWSTAVQAFLSYQRTLHTRDFGTREARADLMKKLRHSWERKPICSAVAITVWQVYFDSLHDEDEDEAARWILCWMPLWCHATTPSAMVKTLTHHGWSLYESLEA